MYTTYNNEHRHLWSPKKLYTSVSNGHRHKTDAGVALAGKTGHRHLLIKPKTNPKRNMSVIINKELKDVNLNYGKVRRYGIRR